MTTANGECSLSGVKSVEWNCFSQNEESCHTFDDFVHFYIHMALMELQTNENILTLARVDAEDNDN